MAQVTIEGNDEPFFLDDDVAHSLAQVLRMMQVKDSEYEQAWRKQGFIGNVGRILSKASRLRAQVWHDDQRHDPKDSLVDLVAIGLFAMANVDGANPWGR